MGAEEQEREGDAEREPAIARVITEDRHPIEEQQIDREALKVLYRLRDAGFKGYLVGGGVRDLYLGRTPKDFDISTDARPGQLRQMFRNSRTIGRRFRLVQVFFRGNKIIEVSTLRSHSEFDIEGEEQILPANNSFGTLEEDAFRRDLTINALFYEIENHTIIDYTGGVEDLERGIIRVVGNPDRRFTRDPVRMMRVVRHAARTGFTIEDETFAALARHQDKLSICPPSRIRDEVLKDLQSAASRPWAELCMRASLWKTLFPFYPGCPENEELRLEIFRIFEALDHLHLRLREMDPPGKVPEPILFAALLLPWARQQFQVPEANVRGPGFARLSRRIREELDRDFGGPFNVQRMAKDAITTLLLNLPAIHHARQQGNEPAWLKKKSYYRNCSRLYALYLESQGVEAARDETFMAEPQHAGQEEIIASPRTERQESGPEEHSGARGRGGAHPAFSSHKHGVFGLRRSD